MGFQSTVESFKDNDAIILPRRRRLQTLTDCLQRYPVVATLGARQVGKTTACSGQASQHLAYVTPVWYRRLYRFPGREQLEAAKCKGIFLTSS